MPTVAREGQFRFVVNTRENEFEPPHTHIWSGNEDVCRIVLNSGRFMEGLRLASTEASCRLMPGMLRP